MNQYSKIREEFDKKFGKFYLKAYDKSRIFWASMGRQQNRAEVDFEAGEEISVGSEDIKDWIVDQHTLFLKELKEKQKELIRKWYVKGQLSGLNEAEAVYNNEIPAPAMVISLEKEMEEELVSLLDQYE